VFLAIHAFVHPALLTAALVLLVALFAAALLIALSASLLTSAVLTALLATAILTSLLVLLLAALLALFCLVLFWIRHERNSCWLSTPRGRGPSFQ